MKFLDKIKDLFSDEEEVIETREIEVEENEEHKLPTFMRNKIEEEQKQKVVLEEKKTVPENDTVIAEREIVRQPSSNSFSFPIDMDDNDFSTQSTYNRQNVLLKEKEKENHLNGLYSKKEEPKPKKFKPTPVISPVYGVLDKNYTKDEVKLQDEDAYEIQRPSRKVDFETVRNKAFGTLTDDIKNNLCENCELYQEVKITKNADKIKKVDDSNLLTDLTDDVNIGTAEENYFDYGVSYEPPKREEKKMTVINIDEPEITNNIKIINHNAEDSVAEKIEVKEPVLDDNKEFENVLHDEETIDSILSKQEDLKTDEMSDDIFNLIDSMYDEEDK